MNKRIKQVFAWIGIVALLGLSIASLIIALCDFEGKTQALFACLGGAVFLPIILWIIIWAYGVMTNKKTIASFRSEEMEQTMKTADEIRYQDSLKDQSEEASDLLTESDVASDSDSEL